MPLSTPGSVSRKRWRALRALLRRPPAVAGLVVTVLLVLVAVLAPWLAPRDPLSQDLVSRLQPPSAQHPLGTDNYGRDVLSRLIWGARLSLTVAVMAPALGLSIGTAMGLAAGYFRGWTDLLVMRLVDVLLSFPGILLALAIAAALGSGVGKVVLAIGIATVPQFARVARGSTLSAREAEYVEGARAAGAGHLRIVLRHILPNIAAPLIILTTLRMATAILYEASLSFLGIGVAPPTPTWGGVIADGRNLLRDAPWISMFGGLATMGAVLGFNLLGDGVRDALDPRLRN